MTDETRRERTGDEEFGSYLRRNADAYNPPPETPVEAIWEGILEARDGADRASREGGEDDGGIIPIGSRRWLLPALAVAAVLVLGIAIGRISMRQADERRGAAGPPVATRSIDPPAPDESRPEDAPAPTADALATTDDDAARSTENPAAVGEGRSNAELAMTPPTEERGEPSRPAVGADRPARPERGPAEEAAPSTPSGTDRVKDLYRLASVQMLAQAEALLIDYRSGRAASPEDAAEIGRWARDVLASTRLLLDSRAARDPGMRALLEDLELVLAQIVHHSGADPIEGEMIDRTIEERDLIPRLRTAIPAGGGASSI